MQWKIGNVEIKNQVGLAPMAGISNFAYIKICEEMGIGFATTELISSEAVVRNNKKTFEMLKGLDRLQIPVAVQIFGFDPNTMAKAAKILTDLYPIQLIDINMGCPVPKVAVKTGAGAALLKDPVKVGEIVRSVVSAVDVSVTVKIRSGWDMDHINAPFIARICEEAGAKAITVHARTRSQGYSGKADLNVIKEVKKSVSIPVIGNGDIRDISSAEEMLRFTHCDAIMIGRAALGNPFLMKRIVTYLDTGVVLKSSSMCDFIDTCLKHISYLLEVKSERLVCLEIRNHVAWYLKGFKGAGEIKNLIYQQNKINDIITILEQYKLEIMKEE